ncbi:MAG: cell division protein ZapB [Treponema sp.]|nr:cell division protein ZapB [Treponema sp.]
MITLEQVKLLESKVSKAIDTIRHLTEENKLLREKLEGYQSRISELEVLVQQFKDDQGKIEAGIVSALDRLNKFEDILEQELGTKQTADTAATNPSSASPHPAQQPTVHTTQPVPPPAVDPDSDEAILAILEQEERARQSTVTISPEPEINSTAPAAELDIF